MRSTGVGDFDWERHCDGGSNQWFAINRWSGWPSWFLSDTDVSCWPFYWTRVWPLPGLVSNTLTHCHTPTFRRLEKAGSSSLFPVLKRKREGTDKKVVFGNSVFWTSALWQAAGSKSIFFRVNISMVTWIIAQITHRWCLNFGAILFPARTGKFESKNFYINENINIQFVRRSYLQDILQAHWTSFKSMICMH